MADRELRSKSKTLHKPTDMLLGAAKNSEMSSTPKSDKRDESGEGWDRDLDKSEDCGGNVFEFVNRRKREMSNKAQSESPQQQMDKDKFDARMMELELEDRKEKMRREKLRFEREEEDYRQQRLLQRERFELEKSRVEADKVRQDKLAEIQKMNVEKRLEQERANAEQERIKSNALLEIEREKVELKKECRMMNVDLPRLGDNTDVEEYLDHFERIATRRNWPKEIWTTQLSERLEGTAMQVYGRLTPAQREDWRTLKEALLRRFQRNAEYYWMQFRNRRKAPDQTFELFLEDVKFSALRWVELSGKDPRNVDDVWDMFIQEQFFSQLDERLATYVREREPKTAEEAAHFAQKRIDAKARSKVDKLVERNRGRKEIVQNQQHSESKEPVEDSEEKHGEAENDKPKVFAKRSKSGYGDVVCYQCNRKGHVKKNCPNNTSHIASVDAKRRIPLIEPVVLCGRCADKPYSPYVHARVNGYEVEALRDTGATDCVVKASLVNEEDLTGQLRKVKLAEKKMELTVNTAIISVDSPFVRGRILAIVMDDPSESLIIGNSVTFVDGTNENVPVYAREELVAAVTRSQSKRTPETKVRESRRDRVIRESGLECTPEEFQRWQKEDETLTDNWSHAETGQEFQSKTGGTISYVVKNGVLRRQFEDRHEKQSQVCVPKVLREEVIRLAHDRPMGGHMGIARTRSRIFQEFYWPGMCADISAYCRSCDACQKTSQKGRVSKFPLGVIPLVDQPFKRVGVDLIGPLEPPSEKGKRYVLVMVDYATKYPEAVSLRSITAEAVSEALFEMWSRLGIPEQVLTDRGTQFTSELMTEVFALLKIKGLMTSPYHAQCNGLVERFNGTLKAMLKRLTREKPRSWDRFLSAALFAYREVPQETTGFSPFELLYGRKIRGPMTILKSLWTDETVEGEAKLASTYVCELRNRISETCAIARQSASASALKQKEWYDKRTKRRDIEKGDKVLVLLPTKRNKLQLEWQGPFPVEEKVGECDFRVAVAGSSRLYHGNLLKKYIERQTPVAVKALAVVNQGSGDEQLETVTEGDIPLISLSRTEGPEDVKLDTTTPERHERIKQLVNEFPNVLSDVPGQCNLIKCQIRLSDPTPVNIKPYPLPHSQREVVAKEVKDMLEMGVIEKSCSPFSSPIVLVKKPDGKIRFCIDFRALNRRVVFDGEPIPDVDHLFTKVRQYQFLSKLDLTKGYWQIPMSENDKEKTAFSTPEGHFHWNVMPFGMSTSGAVFSRMMRELLAPLNRKEICNFIDDVLVATETMEEHLDCLRALFERMAEVGLTVKPSKCLLGFKRLTYLGFVLGDSVIAPEKEKVTKILEAPRPMTKKQVRSFLGLAGFYRRFVPNYATIALPLTEATKKGEPTKVVWTDERERAFRELKAKLASTPICILPRENADFILRTDASDVGLGAVLMQDVGNGPQPIAYASKKLLPAERKYATVEKECFAIVWGVKRFEPYLFGRDFVIQTDHSPLHYLKSVSPANGRLMRWSLLLQDFSFEVKVIPGRENVGADYLSRLEDSPPPKSQESGQGTGVST